MHDWWCRCIRSWRLVLCLSFVMTQRVSISTAYQPYKHTDPDFAASVHHLRLLVLVELDFISTAYRFLPGNQIELTNYLKDFETSIVAPLNASLSWDQFVTLLNDGYIDKENFADETIKHPLKSYRVIRRFIHYINGFTEKIDKTEVLENLQNSQKLVKFPKTSDLEASMQNILRLRQIFKLSVKDLFEGKLGDMNTKSGLTIQQLSEIADHAVSLKMYCHGVDIYDAILQKCKGTTKKLPADCLAVNKTDMTIKLNKVIQEHDDVLRGNVYDRSDFSTVPPDSSPFVFDRTLESMESDKFKNRRLIDVDLEFAAFVKLSNYSKQELDMASSPFVYEKLCRGESLQKNSKRHAALRCTYSQNNHASYLLQPLKMEVHHVDPYIVQIYDVLSNDEISRLQTEVRQELRQSRTTVDGADVEVGKLSRFRTSANAWIEDNDIQAFQYLNERISRITGFNTTGFYSTEIVQIAAYNPGGHYTPHTDAMFEEQIIKWLPESEIIRGDRMMTFMIYLSDVEKGGGTSFPVLKTVIHPVKGSAVAWYNLNSDGNISPDVLHGGCPVLYGTKWISVSAGTGNLPAGADIQPAPTNQPNDNNNPPPPPVPPPATPPPQDSCNNINNDDDQSSSVSDSQDSQAESRPSDTDKLTSGDHNENQNSVREEPHLGPAFLSMKDPHLSASLCPPKDFLTWIPINDGKVGATKASNDCPKKNVKRGPPPEMTSLPRGSNSLQEPKRSRLSSSSNSNGPLLYEVIRCNKGIYCSNTTESSNNGEGKFFSLPTSSPPPNVPEFFVSDPNILVDPPVDVINERLRKDGIFYHVQDLKITHRQHGSVTFLGYRSLYGVKNRDLSQLAIFTHACVDVSEEIKRPPMMVTFSNITRVDLANATGIKVQNDQDVSEKDIENCLDGLAALFKIKHSTYNEIELTWTFLMEYENEASSNLDANKNNN